MSLEIFSQLMQQQQQRQQRNTNDEKKTADSNKNRDTNGTLEEDGKGISDDFPGGTNLFVRLCVVTDCTCDYDTHETYGTHEQEYPVETHKRKSKCPQLVSSAASYTFPHEWSRCSMAAIVYNLFFVFSSPSFCPPKNFLTKKATKLRNNDQNYKYVREA